MQKKKKKIKKSKNQKNKKTKKQKKQKKTKKDLGRSIFSASIVYLFYQPNYFNACEIYYIEKCLFRYFVHPISKWGDWLCNKSK